MKKWRRIIVRIMSYCLIAIILILSIGSIYEWQASKRDKLTYLPVGNLYTVKDKKMHLYTGGEGNVTVVFASGWGTANPYVDFYPLYGALAPHTKYAVYDRFGYGYSDLTNRKRDIDSIVEEIRELLQTSGQQPPYIFVGHSLGALEVIRYAQHYPEEVKGIVMMEGGSPEYYASRQPLTFVPIVQGFLTHTGVMRTLYKLDSFAESMDDQRNELRLLPEELKELDRIATLLLAGNRNMKDEISESRNNAKIILDSKSPLPMPLIVLTADDFGKLPMDKDWDRYESEFPEWSISGKQIIVPESSHYLHQYAPEAVVEAILSLLD